MKKKLSIISLIGLLVSVFYFGASLDANAGNPTEKYLQFSDNTPGASSVTHTIHFKPTVTTGIKQVEIKYCDSAGAWGDACSAPAGLSLPATDGVTLTGFSDTTVTSADYSSPTETIEITSPTTETTSTDHQIAISGITNPSTEGTFYLRIRTYSDTGTTEIDQGSFAAATIDAVTVEGQQLETLSVTVAGGSTVGTGVTVDATSVDFATFTPEVKTADQTVTVGTNASSGYTLSMSENQPLTNGASDTIPDYTTGSWSGGADPGSGNYGFGVSYDGGTSWEAVGTSNPTTSSNPVESEVTTIKFGAAVSATQAAGTYTNTVTYDVTPTY